MRPSILLTILFTGISILSACKKNDDKPNPGNNDLLSLFTNNIWTGDYHAQSQPLAGARYGLHFFTDNKVTLYTINGDSSGTFILEGRKITLNLHGNNIIITAIVSDDNQLTQIQHSTANNWAMTSGTLSPVVAEQPLDGTIWKGSFTNAGTLTLEFKPGNQVTFEDKTYPYTRIKGVIAFDFTKIRFRKFFLTITGNASLTGNYIDGFGNYNSFSATRQ